MAQIEMSDGPLKVVLVAGARPNFMKVAPIIRQLILHAESRAIDPWSLSYQLVHTGQHYDAKMSEMCVEFGISLTRVDNFHIVDPIGYHDSLCLTEFAKFVLTESGGLQEESTFFRTPCLTLRPNTERPVTVAIGSNKLTSLGKLAADIDTCSNLQDRFGRVPPLWDCRAAKRIVDAIIAAS